MPAGMRFLKERKHLKMTGKYFLKTRTTLKCESLKYCKKSIKFSQQLFYSRS